MSFKERLKLNNGERLELTKEFKAGHLGQKERSYYDILNSKGKKVGEVTYKEYSETTGSCRTHYRLKKYDINNQVVLEDSWE